jgi:MFS transporter, UMF1 family
VKSSDRDPNAGKLGAGESIAPGLGELSGDPALVEAAAGVATAGLISRWLAAPAGISATGASISHPLGQISWAVFEWARNPYVLLVTIYIFAPYFTTQVVGDPVRGQSLWGDFASTGAFIVAVTAPFFGAVADAGGRRKPWIAFYTLIMAAAMLLLWRAMPHSDMAGIIFAGAMVAIANVAFEYSYAFHNAMLPTIASNRGVGPLSGLGLALGNAAGVLLFLFMLFAFVLPGKVQWPFVLAHPLFGIDQAAHEPERLAGPMAGLWLLVFSLPLFFFTPDRPSVGLGIWKAMTTGVRSVIRTVRSLDHYRNIGHYLGARAIFNDGMTGVLTFGGIYAAGTFHWGPLAMTIYGIELSVFAVFGGFFGGWLDNRFGSKRALFISIGGTAIAFALSLTMGPDRILWFIAYDPNAPPVHSLPFFRSWPELIYVGIVNFVAIFITAGYANARTMLARIAPPQKMTEFFGLFSLSGTSTTFMAPLAVSLLTVWTHTQRGGMVAVIVFLSLGLLWLTHVREERATAV